VATKEVTVGRLATENVVQVELQATLRNVVEQLVDASVGLVVVAESGSVRGVVSERDVIAALHGGADLDEVWAADVMTEDLIVVDADQDVVTATRLMLDNGARHLLVTRDTTWGVVSMRDILATAS
jgi:predicted transcriptional regulator